MYSQSLIKKSLLLVLIGALLLAPVFSFAQQPLLTQQQITGQQQTNNSPKDAACPGDWITCGLMSSFQWLTVFVSRILTSLAAFLISFAGGIIQMIINAGAEIMESPLATSGFKVSLSIANLGFVLAIIVIAYTTIFRVAGYETKKLLRNLIIAALLVNFSFTIAGVIIDFGNVFGNFFLSAASGGNISNFSENLANALSVQKLNNIVPKNSAGISLLTLSAGFFNIFVSSAAILIFNVVLVITFFAIAFMLIARYVWILLLLILMPLAWLAWIFPGFSHYFSEWWKNFLRWSLFYPAVTLFLYLAVITANDVGKMIGANSSSIGPAQAVESISGFTANSMTALLQIIVQVAIVFGGLFAANKLGIEGAGGAMKAAVGVKNWAIGAAGRATGVPAALRAARAPAGALAQGTAKVLGSRALSWIPGAKGAAAGLYNLAAARKTAVGALQKEEFEKDSDDALLMKSKQYTGDRIRRAAIVNEVVKRNLSEKMDPGQLDSGLEAARDLSSTKEILEKRPDFAPKLATKETREKAEASVIATKPELAGNKELVKLEVDRKITTDAMVKFKPSNTEGLPTNVLGQSAIIAGFTESHVSRLAKEGTEEQRIALVKAAQDLDEDHPVREAFISSPAYQGALASVLKEEKSAFADWIRKKQEEKKPKGNA